MSSGAPGKPGAPAKPASEKYQAVTLRLHPTTVKLLRKLSKRLKLSQGQTVTQALDALETTQAAVCEMGVLTAERRLARRGGAS